MSSSQSRRASRRAASSTASSADPAPERQRRAPLSLQNRSRSVCAKFSPALLRLLLASVVPLAGIAVSLLLFERPLHAQDRLPAGTVPTDALPSGGSVLFAVTLVCLLVLGQAFLTAAEIALITIRKSRLRQLSEEGRPAAVLAEHLLEEPARLIATIQTGVTLIALLAAAVAAVVIVPPMAQMLRGLNPVLFAHRATTVALIVVMLPLATLSLIVGSITPRSLAARYSETFALFVARPVVLLQRVLAPLVLLVTWLSNLLLRPFGGTASFITPAVNEEELKMMVEASEEQGVLEAGETEMIHSILDFGDTVARKIMTPRIDMTVVDVNASVAELIRRVNESGHSRIPLYKENLDNIVGIVHAKDLLGRFDTPLDKISLCDVMRPPHFIPETKKIDELLTEFRHRKQQLALVRDEYGTLAGVVTLEDILEEIVGEIQDEYDTDEPTVQVLDATTTLFDGRTSLDDVNDRMGLELPTDEADTIAGFVFGLLGHQAHTGERVSWGEVEFVVEAMDERRIKRVRLIHQPLSENPDTANSDAGGSGRPIETSGVETAPGMVLRR